MNVHYHILYATMLTAMFITNQGEFALLFPVWAIVAVKPNIQYTPIEQICQGAAYA